MTNFRGCGYWLSSLVLALWVSPLSAVTPLVKPIPPVDLVDDVMPHRDDCGPLPPLFTEPDYSLLDDDDFNVREQASEDVRAWYDANPL